MSTTDRRTALVERLFAAVLGFSDLYAVYLGDRLGLYRALASRDAATPAELAAATSTDERYVREWLEQQAVTGFLEVEPDGRFSLPADYREVFVDPDSLDCMAPFIRMMVGMASPLPALVEAYRTGDGVPYPEYGADTREGIAEMNRAMFVNQLATEWFPAVADVHERLSADPPARVADLGCGSGWSSIAIARAYPKVSVDGLDLDAASVELARRNAEAEGLGDRVRFRQADAGDPELAGRYDLVTAFECIHDMARPVEALRAARGLLADGASLVVADERVAERFDAPGDEVERLMYGFSVLHCLPVGRADHPEPAGTGAVMRPATLERYAREAGFAAVEVLPIENLFWRFYRLVP